MVLGYFGFGHIIYVSLLFTNAIAILNEERFLAKSESARLRVLALLIRLFFRSLFASRPYSAPLTCYL